MTATGTVGAALPMTSAPNRAAVDTAAMFMTIIGSLMESISNHTVENI